jgi:putative ABC transport system permease protein
MHLRLLSWSLRHRRWRHVATIITTAMTAAVVMLFVSIMVDMVTWLNSRSAGDLARASIIPVMVAGDLPTSLYPVLEQIDGVKVVQRSRTLTGRHESTGVSYIVSGEEDSGIELNTDFFPVEPAVFEAWKKERPLGAIVTEDTARELRLTVGQEVEVPTNSGPLKLKIVGLSKGGTISQRIAAHFEYLQEFTKNPGLCRFRIFTMPDDFERVAQAVAEATKNSATPVQAVSASQLAAAVARQISTVPIVLGFLGVFLIFTTALTLANSSAIAIRSRRLEIATMRVLGFHRSTIARFMLGEAMLVGLVGGLVAAAITVLAVGKGIQIAPGQAVLRPIQIGLLGLVCGLVTSVVVPLIGALPSALAAVRAPLVEALREN